MTHPDSPPMPRQANGRFAPGNPGRPFGTQNRMSKRVARALLRDFEANQHELLPRLRRWFIPQYIQIVARLLPKPEHLGGEEIEGLDEVETAALIAAARAAMARIDAGHGSLADLEAALLGERHNSGADTIGD